MPIVTTAAEAHARARQIQVNGREYTLAEYVGAAPTKGMYVEGNEGNDNGMPQGFLVHQPPNATTPAHFHEPNQFQIFVDGSGRIGAFPTTPLTVQYANGHTPYGPIVAFDDGVKYFTLRQRWDPGAKYLPASKDKLITGNQKTRVKGGLVVATAEERASRKDTVAEIVFAPEPDGLAGWLYRIGAGQTAAMPSVTDGGGQYLVVTGGSAVHGGQPLERLSIVFRYPNETDLGITAGSEGLELLVLQFPRSAKN